MWKPDRPQSTSSNVISDIYENISTPIFRTWINCQRWSTRCLRPWASSERTLRNTLWVLWRRRRRSSWRRKIINRHCQMIINDETTESWKSCKLQNYENNKFLKYAKFTAITHKPRFDHQWMQSRTISSLKLLCKFRLLAKASLAASFMCMCTMCVSCVYYVCTICITFCIPCSLPPPPPSARSDRTASYRSRSHPTYCTSMWWQSV